MIVVDAGVVVALLIGDLDPERVGTEELATSHLLDSEVINALRRLVLHGDLTEKQTGAHSLLTTDARLSRVPHLRCPVRVL